MIFVDTSALYAYLDAGDEHHAGARATLAGLLDARADLVSSSYVAVETSALVQRRLGAAAVRVLHEDVLPTVRISWIDEATHRAATAALLASPGRGVSLVDHVSFVLMRELGVTRAFAFDADFESQGFELIPAP